MLLKNIYKNEMPGKCHSVLFLSKEVSWSQGMILVLFMRGQCHLYSYLCGIINRVTYSVVQYTYILGPWSVSCFDLQALSLENTLLVCLWSTQVVSAISSTVAECCPPIHGSPKISTA